MLEHLRTRLYLGLRADCFFDLKDARCLSHVKEADRHQPVNGVCDPHCPHACWARKHVAVWEQSLIDVKRLASRNRISTIQRDILRAKVSRRGCTSFLTWPRTVSMGEDLAIRPETADALRNAMAHLLAGNAKRTNGELIWNNVWVEAGVPRSTAARATEVITEWKALLQARRKSDEPIPTTNTEIIRDLEQRMEKKTRKAAETQQGLRETIRTLANQIQALTLALELKDAVIADLQRQVEAGTGGKVVSIKGGR
jgi:hypothetical protein